MGTQRGRAVAEACRGYTDNAGCLHRWPLWHKESPRNWNTEGPDSTMQPRRETALVRPDGVDPKTHISGQPPDVIQGKGLDITRPCTLLLRLVTLQMHGYVCSSHSAVFNYNHMHHNRRLFLSAHHRNSHHMSVWCANRSYLHFTALHQLNEVSKKDVSVPLAESLCIVGHLEERHTCQRGRGWAVWNLQQNEKQHLCERKRKKTDILA